MNLAMNTTPTHFLVFDADTQTWNETSLEELAMRNDSDLYLTPVYENRQGKPCTWGEYLNQQKAEKEKEKQQRKQQKRLQEQANKANQQKRQIEEEAFKKKQEEESREVMATCVRHISENIASMKVNIEAMKADQLETNKMLRIVCFLFILSAVCAAINFIGAMLN